MLCNNKKTPTRRDRQDLTNIFNIIDKEQIGLISEKQIILFDQKQAEQATKQEKNERTNQVKLLDPTQGDPSASLVQNIDLDAFIALRWRSLPKRPSIILVHGALVLVQVIFGIGSVVGKLGVSKFNPVLFALIREGVAGPLLLAMAVLLEGCKINFRDPMIWRFVAGGIFLFANQLCYIVGEKLSNAVIGSAWQPSQAIFTVMLTIILCMEKATVLKIVGVLVACGGAVFMVVFGSSILPTQNTSHTNSSNHGDLNGVAGNILFAINCLGTSCYVIVAKPLVKKYPPLSVTGWCYITASIFMAISAVSINFSPDAVHLICPVDPSKNSTIFPCGAGSNLNCSCSPWGVPIDAIMPLAYWIVFNSATAYFLMTWGNKYADASKVLAYTALQPLTSVRFQLLRFIHCASFEHLFFYLFYSA
jgi:drug/metabolite transporter (DMT)-like permease